MRTFTEVAVFGLIWAGFCFVILPLLQVSAYKEVTTNNLLVWLIASVLLGTGIIGACILVTNKEEKK